MKWTNPHKGCFGFDGGNSVLRDDCNLHYQRKYDIVLLLRQNSHQILPIVIHWITTIGMHYQTRCTKIVGSHSLH